MWQHGDVDESIKTPRAPSVCSALISVDWLEDITLAQGGAIKVLRWGRCHLRCDSLFDERRGHWEKLCT